MFEHNRNVHYEANGRDNLPKKIRGKARWTKLRDRDWSYIIHAEGKPRSLKYINDVWYQTGWSADTQRYFTNSSQKIEHPKQFRLGTKTAPILSEVDQKCLQGISSTEETNDSQEEGPSMRRGGFRDQEALNQILRGDAEDQPIENKCTDDELSTLIGKVEMTTTETMTKATQQIVKAHIREGGPVDENPMRPSIAIADQVRTLQDRTSTVKEERGDQTMHILYKGLLEIKIRTEDHLVKDCLKEDHLEEDHQEEDPLEEPHHVTSTVRC